MKYSFIIPVYNRPDEIKELLQSFRLLQTEIEFEIVIIEDGSQLDCKEVVAEYSDLLISYYYKENSGPGDSRNFGMKKAKGDFFIILDSDCLLPPQYLDIVDQNLSMDFVDCYGGPDAAHPSFNSLQKGINFAMTSTVSTGGIRGKKINQDKFQARSFNMGLSKEAFEASAGFGDIHPGEDPDLSLRLKKLGFRIKLIPEAFVYHKRRVSWSKFFQQVHKFGLVRPILNKWHPESKKLVFWLPTLFMIGSLGALIMSIMGYIIPLIPIVCYFILIFVMALISERSITVAIKAVMAVIIQLYGYGYGFLKSTFFISLLGNKPQTQYPYLFFNNGRKL